jgi:hypothetical protein
MELEAEASAGKRVRSPSDPISGYNHVATCYNVRYHCTVPPRMHLLPNSRLYQVGYCYLRLYYSIPLLISALIPVLNAIVLMAEALLWILYELAFRIYTKNATYVVNPFQNMFFSPQICSRYAVNNTFLQVPRNFCPPNLINIQNRLTPDGKVKLMFYNGAFRRYYTSFQKGRWVHLGYLMVTLMCCGVSLLIVYPLCGLDVLKTGNSLGLMLYV